MEDQVIIIIIIIIIMLDEWELHFYAAIYSNGYDEVT